MPACFLPLYDSEIPALLASANGCVELETYTGNLRHKLLAGTAFEGLAKDALQIHTRHRWRW